ncbi:hypothetical protein JQC72_12040 [Polycladomyces sp. WAk]|uniref:Uncharacterized protein n=1 Tax=Polycladomyces zharkentensis TaxID=2807616 RepID=A0ABS2WKY4_9BACL|nr:hypothetical protein [Polycladomyces sp. WAk]MBN2910232.1 hypothetical protein [Polycladomyces sp. WAk]
MSNALKGIWILIFAGMLIIGSVVFFTQSQASQPGEIRVTSSSQTITVDTLEKMTHQADYIVVGTFEKFDSTWNAARKGDGPDAKPDPRHYAEGRLYDFHVNEVLKGSIPDRIIKVSIIYAKTEQDLHINGRPSRITMRDPHFIAPVFGKKYILFLTKANNVPPIYGIPFHPYQIQFDDAGKAVLKKPNSQPMIEKKQFGSSQVVITHETDFKMNDTITGRDFKEIKAEILRATKRQ